MIRGNCVRNLEDRSPLVAHFQLPYEVPVVKWLGCLGLAMLVGILAFSFIRITPVGKMLTQIMLLSTKDYKWEPGLKLRALPGARPSYK